MGLTNIEVERIGQNAIQLYDANAINEALDRMAEGITDALSGTVPVILCVLSGSIIPTGHLLTRLSFPLEIDYLHATRYQGITCMRPGTRAAPQASILSGCVRPRRCWLGRMC